MKENIDRLVGHMSSQGFSADDKEAKDTLATLHEGDMYFEEQLTASHANTAGKMLVTLGQSSR